MSVKLVESVLELLDRLERAKIPFKLARNLEDAITIEVVSPGKYWEIDCHSDGSIEVEIFKSDGLLRDEAAIEELFRDFSD